MSRWQPNAQGRLAQAALELYSEQGFDVASAASIAARAGLTERTFFRHFADKREVLFGGADELRDFLAHKVAEAPASADALDAVVGAITAAGVLFRQDRDYYRQRQHVIYANAALKERELAKFATLSATLASRLRCRGTADPGATLAAEAGITVFRVAFERWTGDTGRGDFAEFIQSTLDELRSVICRSAC